MMKHLAPIDELVALHSRDPSSIDDTVASSIERIDEINDDINAVIWRDETFVNEERERTKAHARIPTDRQSLLGLPILVKELDSSIAGTPNSWGNFSLKESGFCDTVTSTSVSLLRNAGAVIVGKTNNPELGLTVTTNSRAHGPCNNPLDVTRNAGGSSGGSAAAVASGMVSVAMGTDGGGSIRIPAAACGVFGFKPTNGVIPFGPLIDEAWSGLVSKGILASRIDDLVRVLDAVSTNKDSFTRSIETPSKQLRIGIRTDGFASMYAIDDSVVTATEKVATFLESCGHKISFASPSTYDDLSIIEKFLDIISYNTFGEVHEIQRRCTQDLDVEMCEAETQYFYNRGAHITAAMYDSTCNAIEPFKQNTTEFFSDFDVLITPTIGKVAPRHGEVESDPELSPFIYGGLCFPSNFCGAPAISVPVTSTDPSGLPVGIQIISAPENDDAVLRLARDLERDYSDIFVTQKSIITS